jgi:UDP-N-acetyl-D-mannosaminuronic acid transferase (WecB/TagA/CpsF family)
MAVKNIKRMSQAERDQISRLFIEQAKACLRDGNPVGYRALLQAATDIKCGR